VPNITLYYAAERRRIELPVVDALRKEALDTLAAARACAQGPRPAPLVNDSKCPRCSLQPFCLPDEVNFERTQAISPRKLWPPRDDAIHYEPADDSDAKPERLGSAGFRCYA
jgi:hypothetical protein